MLAKPDEVRVVKYDVTRSDDQEEYIPGDNSVHRSVGGVYECEYTSFERVNVEWQDTSKEYINNFDSVWPQSDQDAQ